ncbi:MAG TPA: 6-hydroxymethylpterin diphosphokinase MptE-like protein [Bacillales bacterium]|nr:6-hydroxymethylpterin diphosphokinase MptE-like protein [Bacillales bacterium]
MDTTVQNNEQLLKKQLPWLYEQIEDVHLDERSVRVNKARKTNHLILEKCEGDGWISLYSKFDPMDESEKWALSINGNPKNIVMFGFGLGYHFDFLAKRFPDACFHIIEPDVQLTLHYINERKISNGFLSRIENFLISDCSDDYKVFFQTIMHFIDENWLFLSLPKFEKVYSSLFDDYTNAFLECKKNYTDHMISSLSFEKIWNFNVLQNFPQLFQTPSVFDFQDQFIGKTVILTASGPSLNEAIPFIKKAKERQNAIIVAAGTSLNGLLNKGIRPDFFVSYDPFLANYEALKNVLDEEIPFVFGSTIYPAIPAEYKGPKAYLTTTQDKILRYVNPEAEAIPVVNDAPTITGVAMDLLYKLGVGKVYLAGQDLCYINNKTGAEGVYLHNKEGNVDVENIEKETFVENNNGEQSLTSSSFLKMKNCIEAIVGQMDGEIEIYSMSLYGAKIKGIRYRSIHEAETDINEDTVVSIRFEQKGLDEDAMNRALEKFNQEISSLLKIKDSLVRQLERFQTATAKQKGKWRAKVDQSLDRLTHHSGYREIIYPTVANRINYMVRLKNNADFDDASQIIRYFEEGVRPLLDELTSVLEEYQSILSGYNKVNGTNQHFVIKT